MIFGRLLGALALCFASFAPAAAADEAPLFRLRDLGQADVTALGLHSQPVGRAGYQAAFYARGRWHTLESYDKSSGALGANRVGDVVGYDFNSPGGYRALRWTPDGRRHIVELPGDGSDEVGMATGVSRDGLVVGKYAESLDDWETQDSCFIARPGEKAIDPSPRHCVMGGVNASGTVAAGGPEGRGFIWHNGKVKHHLEPLPGYTVVQPMAINDKGHVTGWMSGPQARQVGFVWKGGEVVDLGTLENGPYGYFRSLNNHGVIVGDGVTPEGEQHALIVIDGQVQRLAARVSNLGGWELTSAVAIDDEGTVVGRGWLDGQLRAYRLVPMKRPG